MRLHYNSYIAILLLSALASCSSNDFGTTTDLDWVQISPNEDRVLTRQIVSESNYTDKIGSVTLYHDNVNNTQQSEYKFDGTKWNPTPPIYWQDMTKTKLADGNSYFVFYAVAPQPIADASKHSVITDQSADAPTGQLADLTKSDLLMGYVTTPKRISTVKIPLRHLMSQVQIKLNTDNGYDSVPKLVLASSNVVIDGLATNYSIDYSNSTDSIPAVATATGEGGTNLLPYHDIAAGDYRFITPPQQLAPGKLKVSISYMMNGTKYTYAWSNSGLISFKPGEITQINLRVTKSGIAFGVVSLAAWSTPTILSGTAAIVLDDAESSSQVTSMRIWLGENNETDKASNGRDYRYNSSAWMVADGQTPFYIETILATDKFFAISRPDNSEADKYTNIRDVLSTKTTGEHMDQATGRLSLEFAHLNSQIKVALKRGEGFPSNIDLSTAKLQLLGYSDSESFSGVNAIVDESVTATSAEIPVAAQSGETEACSPAIVMMSQKLGEDAKIKMTVAGRTYITSIKDLNLEAGKCDSLTLVVTGSKLLPGSITVKDWETKSATYKMVIDGLNSTTGVGNVTPVVGDSLQVIYNKRDTAEYCYDGTDWKSVKPIYWDDLPLAKDVSNKYPFDVTYKMYGSYNYTTFGPEVLVYSGTSTNGFGEMLNVNITPIMSKLNISLKPGVGYESYTEEQFLAMLTSQKFTLTINGVAAKSYDFINKRDYILSPQTFTDNDKIVLALADGNTYSMKFSKVEIDNKAWTKLEPGKYYKLTLLVDKTALKTSLNAVGWDEITAEGSFGY